MSLISISNLTFAYDGSYDNIFENVSFQINTDWKLGFVGRNGRGKTTFLNLLLGKYEYSGIISSSVEFDYFPFKIENKTSDTIEIINNINCNYDFWKLQREFSKLCLSDDILYRPFNTLSNGEQTKVLLAVLFLKENNFLLIDEPTNHLDLNARKIVGDYLKIKKGFILVSHDRAFLDNCVDHILSINKTNIEVQKGNFSSWYYNKNLQDNFELNENEKLKKDIKRLEAAARKTKVWGDKVEATKIGKKSFIYEKSIDTRAYVGEKSRRMQQRRKNLERRQQKQIEEKSNLLKNIESVDSLKVEPIQYYKDRLILLENVSIFYDDILVNDKINFSINQGDRISLQGKNGCGKSSIIKLIVDKNIKFKGNIEKGNNIIISYVPQDTSFLEGNLSDYAKNYNIDESLYKAILRKLDFSRIQFEKNMQDFSEGQKKKVLIARSLCEKAHLYIWDEPLNFIDIFSRMQIEDLILKYKPTLLFVEHDLKFTEKIATNIINL